MVAVGGGGPADIRGDDARAPFEVERVTAIRAVRAAATAVIGDFGRVRVTGPVATRPTAEIDRAADRLLAELLVGAFPQYGWLSEESEERATDAATPRWVVDPLDGTREFVLGIPEFAVSVALVLHGRPVVAALVNPIAGHVYDAVAGGGARRDEAPLAVSTTASLGGATILASRSEVERGEWKRFGRAMDVTPMGSVAHKLALVAAGEADATFTLVPKHTWDVAAGVLLVQEAGGVVTTLDGAPVSLDCPGHLLSGLIASNGSLHRQLLEAITGGARAPSRAAPAPAAT